MGIKINKKRWFKMSFAEQMGNIGSEFSRMISLKQNEQLECAKNSFERFLELLDLTILKRPSRELFRLREVVCDLFLEKHNYNVSVESLKDYFINFALIKN